MEEWGVGGQEAKRVNKTFVINSRTFAAAAGPVRAHTLPTDRALSRV